MRAITGGADVHYGKYWDFDGTLGGEATAMHVAAANGNDKVMEYLIREAGSKVDVPDTGEWGWTPCDWACWQGNPNAIAILLALGADVNRVDRTFGATPCMRAARRGHVECITALAASGTMNVNAVGDMVGGAYQGKTALDCAIEEGKDDAAAKLRELGGKEAKDL